MSMPKDDKQNCPFCRLELLVEKFGSTNEALIKVPKVFKPSNK